MPLKPQAKVKKHITVSAFLESVGQSLKLTLVCGEKGLNNFIIDQSINRPALTLTGFFKNFAAKRIQLFGAGEMSYIRDMSESKQEEVFDKMMSKGIPCIVVARNLLPTPIMENLARKYDVPLMRSSLSSRDFSTQAILYLDEQFAPQIAQHGTLMDIKGIGTLIRGKSGVGKSECALALIERGHSLVADDLVYIRLVNERELEGRSSDLNRGYMECRGIGIVNIAELFGVRSVRKEDSIDLVVTFKEWEHGMDEERTGLEQDSFEILNVKIPHIVLPVRPGRDLARLVEVAAMVQALKNLGHDSAKEFNDRLIAFMAGDRK